MSALRRFWRWLTHQENVDGLSPLSEKALAERRVARLLAELTEVESRWWATRNRKRGQS